LELSDIKTALIVTMLGEGKVAGAVKSPFVVIVPTVLLPPGTLFTLQLTCCGMTGPVERNALNGCD
jgi:hypothetical protein